MGVGEDCPIRAYDESGAKPRDGPLAGAPTEELLEYIGGNLLDRLRLNRNY